MGARALTLGEFFAEAGFGQLEPLAAQQFPEYPLQNQQLQAALQRLPLTDATIQSALGLFQLARSYRQVGQVAQEQQVLAQISQLLAPVGGGMSAGRWLAIVTAVVALVVLAVVVAQRPRPAFPRRRRRPRPEPVEDEDEDENENENEEDEDGEEEAADADADAA